MDPVMTALLPRMLVLPMGAALPNDRTVHFSFILDTMRCASRPALLIGVSTVDAFSVPRSEHPRPADVHSPSEARFRALQVSDSFRQGKLGSPSEKLLHSP